MRRIFKKLHLWLTFPFGLVTTIVCFSGAMLVFEEDIKEIIDRDKYFVGSVSSDPLPMERLLEKVAATLPDSVTVTGITIPSDKERTYIVNLSQPHRAAVYINPYTGEITGKSDQSGFFYNMLWLHRWLLDDDYTGGKMIVGVSTLAMIVIMLTGLIIWWPRTVKRLKGSFRIVTDKGWRRLMYDLHIAGSLYSFILLLVLALTGLTWSFDWYGKLYYRTFGVTEQQERGHEGGHEGGDIEEPTLPASYVNWQKVYERIAEDNPDCKEINIYDGMAQVSSDALGNRLALDSYAFNGSTGAIISYSPHKDTDQETKVWGWTYSIHTGIWGGMLTKTLSFIAAMLGATLPLTGCCLWIKSLEKRKKKHEE